MKSRNHVRKQKITKNQKTTKKNQKNFGVIYPKMMFTPQFGQNVVTFKYAR